MSILSRQPQNNIGLTRAEIYLSNPVGRKWAEDKISEGSYIFTSKTPIVPGDFKPGQRIDVYRAPRIVALQPLEICVNKLPKKSGLITIDRGAICDVLGYDKPYFDGLGLDQDLYLDGTPGGISDDVIVVKPRSRMEYYLGNTFTNNRYADRRTRSWLPSNGGRKRTARRQQQKSRKQQQKRQQQKHRTRKQKRQ
jgi:hypothetical protein